MNTDPFARCQCAAPTNFETSELCGVCGLKHRPVKAATNEARRLRERNVELEANLASMTATRDRLRDVKWEGITKLESEIATLRNELNWAKAQLELTQPHYGDDTPETKAFLLLIDDSEVDLGQIESKLSDFENERNSARRSLATLRDSLAKAQGEVAAQKTRADLLLGDLMELRTKADFLQKEASIAEGDRDELFSKNAELSEQRAAAQAACEAATRERDGLQRLIDQKGSEEKAAFTMEPAEIGKLGASIAALTAERDTLKLVLKRLWDWSENWTGPYSQLRQFEQFIAIKRVLGL